MGGSDPWRQETPPERERIPFFQRLLDNHFLLLFLAIGAAQPVTSPTKAR